MKYTIVVSSLFIILSSCNSITDKQPQKPTNELVERFKPFLHGVWIQADYIDDIAKTKSPFKSSEKLTFISEMIIDTSNVATDSMLINIALGNHEGSDFILYFKQGKTPMSLLTGIRGFELESDSYELGYEINNYDTTLILYHYKKNQKLLDKTKYIRVIEVSHNRSLEDGFQYMVNKKLITGSYLVTDSTDKERLVQMTSEGVVKGLPGIETYYVITDFVASEDSSDVICFDIQTDTQNCYAFKINGDTITLFKAPINETDTLFNAGHALYKFLKQH